MKKNIGSNLIFKYNTFKKLSSINADVEYTSREDEFVIQDR